MNIQPIKHGNTLYKAIYDKEAFHDASQFDYATSGGGWGAQTGMSLEASARMDTNNTTFTVHLNAAFAASQSMAKADTKLSDRASADLKNQGIGEFIAKYGTHFVAGYVYGKSCKASYEMKFHSLDMMLAFTAKYSEAASGLGFNESTEASLSNTLNVTSTRCDISASSKPQGSSPGSAGVAVEV